MIEYLLIFALGFCASALLVLLVSPAIHRRVVKLTERRMRATVALTSAEVRAEKDAARARFAADNSRLAVELRHERDRRGTLAADHARLVNALDAAGTAHGELDRRFRDASDEGGRLGTELRDRDERITGMEAELDEAERLRETKDREIEELAGRAESIAGDLEEARVDIATRDRHADMLRSQIKELRGERTSLREAGRTAEAALRDLTIRLEHSEARARGLDGKLATSIAELSDRDGALERSRHEVAELRERVARLGEEHAAAEARCHALEAELARRGESDAAMAQDASGAQDVSGLERTRTMNGRKRQSAAINRRIEQLRNRHAQLVNTLTEANASERDAELRDEIAEIAAMMVDLTAAREGEASPLHGILAADEPGRRANGRPSLAERSRRHIEASADGE